jgi:hypothetical protein
VRSALVVVFRWSGTARGRTRWRRCPSPERSIARFSKMAMTAPLCELNRSSRHGDQAFWGGADHMAALAVLQNARDTILMRMYTHILIFSAKSMSSKLASRFFLP